MSLFGNSPVSVHSIPSALMGLELEGPETPNSDQVEESPALFLLQVQKLWLLGLGPVVVSGSGRSPRESLLGTRPSSEGREGLNQGLGSCWGSPPEDRVSTSWVRTCNVAPKSLSPSRKLTLTLILCPSC